MQKSPYNFTKPLTSPCVCVARTPVAPFSARFFPDFSRKTLVSSGNEFIYSISQAMVVFPLEKVYFPGRARPVFPARPGAQKSLTMDAVLFPLERTFLNPF
jgi:hypothetical protein